MGERFLQKRDLARPLTDHPPTAQGLYRHYGRARDPVAALAAELLRGRHWLHGRQITEREAAILAASLWERVLERVEATYQEGI